MQTLIDLIIKKYGTHQNLADKLDVSRQNISRYNLIKDNNKRNSIGFEMLLKSEDTFDETVLCDGYLITVKKIKL